MHQGESSDPLDDEMGTFSKTTEKAVLSTTYSLQIVREAPHFKIVKTITMQLQFLC